MPRTSRSVAQRLAAQSRTKKRRSPRTGTPSQESSAATTPASSPTIAEILDEVVPSQGGSRAESAAALAPAAPARPANRPPASGGAAARRGSALRAATRPAPVRRRYQEYAAEYQYVWNDLRRILIVAGVLIALLVVLSFFLQ
jgi:hypothetical protein